MRASTFAVVLGCALALPAAAQETPEQVLTRYWDSLRAGDYAATAALMDPAALEDLKRSLSRLAFTAITDEDEAELRQTLGVGPAELDALTPRELYTRILRSSLGGSDMRAILGATAIVVLGHVAEGADLAYVVYRMRMRAAGTNVEQVKLAPMRRTTEGWRVQLTGELPGMPRGPAASGRP